VSPEPIPQSLNVPLPALIGLCVEHWRLSRSITAAPRLDAAARHALRRIEDFLKLCELEARTLDGHPFDAGLAVRVVDTADDPLLPEGNAVIAETLSPIVLWRGTVARPADVVTHRGTKRDS
jgi:hypothetical protein